MNLFRIKAICPDMKAQIDMQQIRETLNDSPGFSTIDFNIAEHRVEVLTANQDGGRDIIHKLSHSGFPAEDFEIEQLDSHTPEREAAQDHS